MHKEITEPIEECTCEQCNILYTQTAKSGKRRRLGKIANGRNLCQPCTKLENSKNFGRAGTKALSQLTVDERKENSRIAGLKQASMPNKGRFQKEKWKDVSYEARVLHSKRANAGLQKKLEDPDYAAQHWLKVHAQKRIGYISKHHNELHSFISEHGFIQHHIIDKMEVDECHPDLKIVIEYNGDYWHCNPAAWKSEDYNKQIKMTAGEKWKRDRARNYMLRKMGYYVITVWESEWKQDKVSILSRIKEVYNEISEKNSNRETDLL